MKLSFSSIVGAEPASAASHSPRYARNTVRARTIAFLVVAGTSILYIWDIQVTSLACVVRKRRLHLWNLRVPTSTLRFEYGFGRSMAELRRIFRVQGERERTLEPLHNWRVKVHLEHKVFPQFLIAMT